MAETAALSLPPSDSPEVPASEPLRTLAAHQETLDRMAAAASRVLTAKTGGPPIRVRAHAAQERYAHATGDRQPVAIATYVPADPSEGVPFPVVEVALGGTLTMDASTVACAVALGAVLTAHPGRGVDAVKRQRRALHGLTGAPKAPASLRLADIFGDRRPDTGPLAQAIRAARDAQAGDPDPIGGAAQAGVRVGKRWTLPNALTGKASELRFAGIIPAAWNGLEGTLTLTVGKESVTLATGTLVYEKR